MERAAVCHLTQMQLSQQSLKALSLLIFVVDGEAVLVEDDGFHSELNSYTRRGDIFRIIAADSKAKSEWTGFIKQRCGKGNKLEPPPVLKERDTRLCADHRQSSFPGTSFLSGVRFLKVVGPGTAWITPPSNWSPWWWWWWEPSLPRAESGIWHRENRSQWTSPIFSHFSRPNNYLQW